ncbi:hypothetical protein [Bosea sp. ASV33]|uniref:hypothetical protein n=1 Tax=Bosea sp. ASV33 TaxID=2795106 RepID=UPI0018EE261F|nr:hypothetical protein [Bosea sp. ASV33]
MRSQNPVLALALVATSFGVGSAVGQPTGCPVADAAGHIVFADGAILMETKLAVNPDGAAASYLPGDHGLTYLNNGVNLSRGGKKVGCVANQALCASEWRRAELGAFGSGTPEFCVFAIEAEPILPGSSLVPCERPREGRFLVGNGKGQPKLGDAIASVSGTSVRPYVSTTSLRHRKDGKTAYLDSGAIPGLVVPLERADLKGSLAWVRYGAHSTFAIVSDTGPAFGEGSVALHQLLRTGAVTPLPAVGPIPVGARCGPAESGLLPPFQSKPDGGKADRCRTGHKPGTSADIRAYEGIGRGVVSVILARAKPPMTGSTVSEEVTTDRLRNWADAAGYGTSKLEAMARCLSSASRGVKGGG